MRNTPRHLRSSSRPGGAIGTLIGNGWLREQPREVWPKNRWDALRKSSLRKCMFMIVPEEVRRLAPQISQAALPPQPRVVRPEPEIVPHRRDPRKDARELPVFVPGAQPQVGAQFAAQPQVAAQAWWEDPVALGSLLILAPPVGLAAVWSSKRYSRDARWALTVMTALTMCLMSAIAIAALTMR